VRNRDVSGTSFQLRHGLYSACVASVGASLRGLQWSGRDLVAPYRAGQVRPKYSGALLAPWPNRVADGRWNLRGVAQQLALTEPEHGHALHGLALWLDWVPRHVSAAAVTLTTSVCPQPGYPFLLDLAATWRLSARGLTCRLVAVNRGAEAAPYGCGVHPYLIAASGDLDDWTFHLPARRQLQVDARQTPTNVAAPRAEHDFRRPCRIGGTRLDHAYTGVEFDLAERARVSVTDEAGRGSAIEFDSSCRWVQIYTAEVVNELDGDRGGVAVEPMTCPPNALQTGRDLIMLQPGARHSVAWRLFASNG
jgi:aldose 1-epimerase